MTWQWWTTQAFAFVGLVFVIISFQQKSTKRLIGFRNIATLMVFIGLFFLGNTSAIALSGAGVVRNAAALYFAYKPNTKPIWKYAAGALVLSVLVTFNIIFWQNYYNLCSIFLGTLNLVTFFQSSPKRIRYLSVVAETLMVVYFSLLFSPVNIAIEAFSLVAAVVGIIRLDIRRKKIGTLIQESKKSEDELQENSGV